MVRQSQEKASVVKEIENLCESHNLRDIRRTLNPDLSRFTWRNKSLKVQCRLDFFLISDDLCNLTKKCEISLAPESDHSAVSIHIQSDILEQKKGPGFWKFNTTLLEDEVYIAALQENLPKFKEKYSDLTDSGLKWDLIKMEFYRFFWTEISNELIDSFNYAFKSGSLSISQRRGIISLIPKKFKDKTILENLRPISLLNVDYKILTKTIAKRLEKVLPNIINIDQTGYVKGRYIGENIRLIQDVIHFTNLTNQKGIAIFLDFKKAFDSVEWSYLNAALELFNFGPDILNWIKIIYNDASSCVVNNGHGSTFFPLQRGVRQGCPLSGILFVLGIELFARALKNEASVKGIRVEGQEIKVAQYADDTTVFVRDKESVLELLDFLREFSSLSGLEINTSKTEAMWLGQWKNNQDTPFGFKWPKEPILSLGVFFSHNQTDADELNFGAKIRDLENSLHNWKRRKLTLYGKINIVKTLGLSKLIFNASVLYIPHHYIEQINNITLNFICMGQ